MARKALHNPEPNLRLRDGARIVIVGGGPAGSFFARYAHNLAKELDLSVEVTILDGKNFTMQGPVGCNMCAGVISAPLSAGLRQLGFYLPEGRVQQRVEGYYVRTVAGGFALDHPDGAGEIRTVFRGNGPRFAAAHDNISFDDFLLGEVKAEGARMVPYPVQDIALPADPRAPASVVYGDGRHRETLEAELLVGAFGLNTALLQKVRSLGFGYEPPISRRACQAELPVDAEWIEQQLKNRIVVVFRRIGPVRLAALTPKGAHVTLTLLGDRDLKPGDLQEFLAHPAARDLFPPGWSLPADYCHCFPRLAATAAKRPFTDRFVLIGDASFSRFYKNGIESALTTAGLAAETAFRLGVSAASFREGYLKPANRLIVRDNLYGRLLFWIPSLINRHRLVAEAEQRLVEEEKRAPMANSLSRDLWNTLTGDQPYRNIFWRVIHPRLVWRLAAALVAARRERWVARRGRERKAV